MCFLDESGSLAKVSGRLLRLETLQIQNLKLPLDGDGGNILDLFVNCPSLKSAKIVTEGGEVTSQAFQLPWAQLEELHMEIPCGLPAAFCTSLVSLTIAYVWHEPWNRHSTVPVALEQLETLQLLPPHSDLRTLLIPFRYLTLPKLHTLTLESELFEISWHHNDFLQFMDRSQCPIKKIQFTLGMLVVQDPGVEIPAFLEALPNLEDLHIEIDDWGGSDLSSALFRSLHALPVMTPVLPCLQTLSITFDSNPVDYNLSGATY